MESCPKCGDKDLRMRAVVFIFTSAKLFGNITKTELIRSGKTKVEGVDWDRTRIYCFKCGWHSALPGEQK